MKALTITAPGQCSFADVPTMPLESGQVRVEVKYVGLCGSDLNTFSGLNPLVELPRIPGHEIGGRVVAISEDVPAHFKPGLKVVVIPYSTCGTCSACRAGRVNACRFNQTLGVQRDGGLRAQIVVNHDRLILNDTLTEPRLALVEPLSVGFHAVGRGRVSSDDTVLVLGGGMIGVGAILGAKARGARVIVSEIAEAKHDVLRALGVDAVIHPGPQDLHAELENLTGANGPDVVIEAVGLPQTFRDAVEVAPFAGRVVYIGYAKTEVSYNTSLFNLKELDIMGSRNATRADFEAVITFLERYPDLTDPLISKIFPWDDAEAALDYWIENRADTFKLLIDVGGRHV